MLHLIAKRRINDAHVFLIDLVASKDNGASDTDSLSMCIVGI